MCENDSVEEKSEVKATEQIPSVSTESKGVAKIFILTPEILQTLGLTGFTNTRIASRDQTKAMKFSIPTLQGIQANDEQRESNKNVITIGKLLEDSLGNTTVIKKPRRDSISEKNVKDKGETSKASVSSSAALERRLNGASPNRSVANAKVDVPIGTTPPKAKSVRRKSNANSPIIQTQEPIKNAVETKNDSQQVASNLRTSKRVAKPKKFDDFVLTENLLSYGRTGNDATTEKPRSRRSSINSESPTPATKKVSAKANRTEKSEAASVGVKDGTVSKTTVEREVPGPEASDGAEKAERLSPENCFTVPEPPTVVRKKSVDKSDDKRSPKTPPINKSLGLKGKTLSKKGVEVADFKQPNSDTRNNLLPREDNFLVPKSPSIVDKKKFHKANAKPNLIKKQTAERIVTEVETTLKILASDNKSETKESLSTVAAQQVVQKTETTLKKAVVISAIEQGKSETKEILATVTAKQVVQDAETTLKKGVELLASDQEKVETKERLSTITSKQVVQKAETALKKGVELLTSHQEKSETKKRLSTDPAKQVVRKVEASLKLDDEISVSQQEKLETKESARTVITQQVVPTVETALKKGVDILASDEGKSETTERLFTRTAKQDVQKVETALKKGVDILASDEGKSETMERLFTRTAKQDVQKVETALKKGVDILASDEGKSETKERLFTRTAKQDVQKVETALKKGVDILASEEGKAETKERLSTLAAEQVVQKVETALKKGVELSPTEQEISETSESLSTVQSTEKTENDHEKPLNTATTELVSSTRKKEKCQPLRSDPVICSRKAEVRSSKNDVLKSFKKKQVRVLQPTLRRSLGKKKETSGSKSDPLKLSDKEQKIIGSNSNLAGSEDKNEKASSSESSPVIHLDNKSEASDAGSDPPRAPINKEEACASRSVLPEPHIKKEKLSPPKPHFPKATHPKEEVNNSKSDPLKSPNKNEVVCSTELRSPRSSHRKEEGKSSKLDLLTSLDKRPKKIEDRGIKSDFLSSSDKKTDVSISQFDAPRSVEKIEDGAIISNSSSFSDKKKEVNTSQPASPLSPEKKEQINILNFALPRSSDNKKEEISIAEFDSSMAPDKKEEVNVSEFNSPSSPDRKEVVAEFASPRFANIKQEAVVSEFQPDQPISPATNEDKSVFQFDSPLSSDKIEDTESMKSSRSTSPVAYLNLFEIDVNVDPTDNVEHMNTDISMINETGCYIEVGDSPMDDPLINVPNGTKCTTGISLFPDKTQDELESFSAGMEVDNTFNLDIDITTEIPLINDTSFYNDDNEMATITPLNKASTVEVIKNDDANFAETTADKTIESSVPISTHYRKGKSRRSLILSESSSLVVETDASIETPSIAEIEKSGDNKSRRKRRMLTNEDVTDGKGLSDGSEDDNENNEVLPRRRGRPPMLGHRRGRGRGRGRVQMDTEYVPRVSSSSKEKAKIDETPSVDDSQPSTETAEPPKIGEIECGKCKDRMAKKLWPKHNLMKHNNMGWLSSDPKPDWDNDVKLLRSILTAILKKKKKTQLVCEICRAGKRSANGFISHLQFCGKTDDERQSLMMTCPICDHVMMPSSMEMHERTHRQDDKTEKVQKKAPTPETGVPPASTRAKRKAAEKAATKIQEFTDLVKDDEPEAKKPRTKEEMIELIEKPQISGNAPNRFKGMWKNDIAKNGKASCRHQDCTFVTDSMEAICNHHTDCSFSPRSKYICKLCLFSSQTEEEAMKHVAAEHSEGKLKEVADSDFENSGSEDNSSGCDTDSEVSDTKPRTTVSYKRDDKYQLQDYNVRFLDAEAKIDSRWPFTFPPALRWTMEFEFKNYRLRLFEDLPPNPMKLLEHEACLDYLPELSRSMKIKLSDARGPTSARWSYCERFKGTVISETPTLFAGGPIWAIAWLPIPAPMYDHSVEQFVAISTHSTMESVYAVGKSHVGNNVIQIWNLGSLDHSRSVAPSVPILAYGVAHDKGTIWCMEWCPSGCYEDPTLLESEETTENKNKKRMGLLATACSDGCVHVFSLPFPEELDFPEDEATSRLPIYATKPILTLTINTRMYDEGEQNWQCTKLNWSKELGHDTIIAGFSNGHVAMWDLASKSPIFVTTRGETTFIEPFHHIYAHGHAVSAVQLIPYGGKRFFITSSYDRMTKLWDLEDTSIPVTGLKRGIVVDGSWFTHWPAYATAHDDVLTYAHTYLLALRQPGAKIFPLLPTNSPTYTVSTSDYGNSVGHGTLAGEVVVMFPNQLWTYRDMEKLSYKKRWLASTIEIVDFQSETSGSKRKKPGKDYEYMPETYDECKDRYGLIFHNRLDRAEPYNRKHRSKNPLADKMKTVNVEQYPFASANRVSWNPNAWSYLWLCVAYQNGVVRFLNFNTMALNKELRKLLPAHARTMLKDAKTLNSNSEVHSDRIDSSLSQPDS